ncbi:hypothetical protein B4168_1904 [Anoxybacillus flavithermus]|nr:hypothetical protein B4168_1904 [Anoxybacillus flavithermus]OAO85559.1 hypothetical protein GT23_2462 [Parageobacillus thermoglucosidasius]
MFQPLANITDGNKEMIKLLALVLQRFFFIREDFMRENTWNDSYNL